MFWNHWILPKKWLFFSELQTMALVPWSFINSAMVFLILWPSWQLNMERPWVGIRLLFGNHHPLKNSPMVGMSLTFQEEVSFYLLTSKKKWPWDSLKQQFFVIKIGDHISGEELTWELVTTASKTRTVMLVCLWVTTVMANTKEIKRRGLHFVVPLKEVFSKSSNTKSFGLNGD